MQENEPKEIAVKGLVPTANIGAGMSIGYACLCFAFWANAMGFTVPGGFDIAIGVVLIGFFVIYWVGGMYFLKQGNTISGAIFVTFACVFGLFSGGMNLTGAICTTLGVPFDYTILNISFVLAGLFLLFILPSMTGFSKVDFCCFLFSGIGVAGFGVAGLGIAPDIANAIAGWSILIGGICSYYGGVAAVLAASGKTLPKGAPFF